MSEPRREFMQPCLPYVFLLLYLIPNCLAILGGILLFTNYKKFRKLRRAVWEKIHEGRFTDGERAAFLVAGVVLVFWCQFSGIMVMDFDDRRGSTSLDLKMMRQQGSLYGHEHDPSKCELLMPCPMMRRWIYR